MAIQRKIRPVHINELNKSELNRWNKHYYSFKEKLEDVKFGAVIFDYDRTLCSDKNRLVGPTKEILIELNRLLKAGITIGIVTGRGQSIKNDLRKLIDKKYWNEIIIGYYNGAEIASLDNNTYPNTQLPIDPVFGGIIKVLNVADFKKHIDIQPRPYQLTIESKNTGEWESIKALIYQSVMLIKNDGVMILESSRSLDIIKRPEVSKLNILKYCKPLLEQKRAPENCLCIGDKGKWPGNDFELLSTPYSLSVNEVSLDPDTCWNISSFGVTNDKACLLYLKQIHPTKNFFKFIVNE
ncbi:MAG: HAD hydrolase family protein [Bacteroidetes bacterium]|nr:HAD hydrolase family protein [Bacteroidota bacterium]